MLKITCTLISKSPFQFSKAITSIKKTGETHDAFEERTWLERAHVDEKGDVFIPPMALKNCLAEVAKYLSETIPGKGKATYTKHFEAGIMVFEPMYVRKKLKDLERLRLHVPSDGKRGGGNRVWKNFPVMKSWKAKASIHVIDPVLIDKPEKIQEYLIHAGSFIGMGAFRPRNNGYYGRFNVDDFKYENLDEGAGYL